MILQALNSYYQRLADREQVPPFGYSEERISYALVISPDGSLVNVDDVRDLSGNKPRARTIRVPQELEERTSGIRPHFLWDKSSYVLGVTANETKCAEKHAAFKQFHKKILEGESDEGLHALLAFLERWEPHKFQAPFFNKEMLDANFVFRLDNEREYLHERPVARDIRERLLAISDAEHGECLVAGRQAPLARVHPRIKGVDGAQTSGASIASFNDDAYLSYGGKKNDTGTNSPVSEQAAFAYTAVLNHLLRRDVHNRQRLQIGDSTTVFWAEADSKEKSEVAELTFADMLNPPSDDIQEAAKLRSILDAVSKGRPLNELNPQLDENTKIYVLGLGAPSKSRLTVRFWEIGSLNLFVHRLAAHYEDLRIEPLPWKTEPAVWRLLYATTPSRNGKTKADDIPPRLGGEMMRAILTGSRYPRSLLTNMIMRFRADGDISGLRVALCKAVLTRDRRLGVKTINEEIPMSLDKQSTHPGYRLGRLFAELENVQKAALGSNVNATIRDRYFGAASATPASVFPVLLRNTQHHLSRLRKDKPGLAFTLEKEIGEIMDGLGTQFPRSLRIEDQGRFAIGYYHQSNARFAGKDERAENETEIDTEE
ncbi:MAG: type I-C CRISPR-associated protein Cas8c/Csd1 [Methylohalobius sp. ZOD2]